MGTNREEGKWGYVCGCSTAQQSLERDVQHLHLPHTLNTSSGMGYFLSVCPPPDDLTDSVDTSSAGKGTTLGASRDNGKVREDENHLFIVPLELAEDEN